MLIVAIPKSASTSLMSTLAELHGLEKKQRHFPDNDIPVHSKLVHRYHSDYRELLTVDVEELYQDTILYKQHIPPTSNNLKRLEGRKVIVLLRDPGDVVKAYCRAEQKNIHEPRQEFAHCKTEADWLKTSVENGLLDDLKWFYEEWMQAAERDPANVKIIQFHELIENPKHAVNVVENVFNLDLQSEVVLKKIRYSKKTWIHTLKCKAWKVAKKLSLVKG